MGRLSWLRYGLYLADLRRDQNDSHGTINYALGLASALPELMLPEESFFVLANPSIQEELTDVQSGSRSQLDLIPNPVTRAARLMHDHVRSSRWARERNLDLIHFPKGLVPMLRPSCPVVATLHDDIPVRLARGELGPSGHRLKRVYFSWAARHALRSADQVLTVSAYSAKQLASLAGEKAPPIAVTYQGITLPDRAFVPLEARNHAILILGSPFVHKRSRESIEWAARYADSNLAAGLRVVVTGRLRPECEQICEALRVTRVRHVLTVGELADLVASSRVLVFGSGYEGFGLPPVEAYSLGTPATHQRVGAMAEVLSGFPGGHERWSYDCFSLAMDTVLALDDQQLRSLRSRMRQRYRWSEVARRTLEGYRAVAQSAIRPGAVGRRR